MSISELGIVVGVLSAIAGVVWRLFTAISAIERRLETAINQLKLESVPRAEIDRLKSRHRAVEGFLIKHFSVNLDLYEMD
jgi:hypothetical protein